jgi:plexin A
MLTLKRLAGGWAKLALLCFCFLSPSLDIVSSEKFIVKEFSDEFAWLDSEIPQFNNLVVDKNTGRVYIGAVNKLYQLSPGTNLLNCSPLLGQ